MKRMMKRMIRRIKSLFSKDILIKIFSLAVAIITWIGVMNTITPIETKMFSVPVKFENSKVLMEQGYIISNIESFKNYTVDVVIEASRPALDDLSKESNQNAITANIDLKDVKVNENSAFPQSILVSVNPTVPLYLDPHKYTISNYDPSYVTIEIDKMASLEEEVNINTVGKTTDDYEINSITLSNEKVTINGPVSKIEDVAKVAVEIDVTDLTESKVFTVEPKAYDKLGNELNDFVSDPQRITAEVSVHKKNTIDIEEPLTIGELPPYLKLTSIDWSPKQITVIGSNENISSLQSISLEPIDLSVLRGDTTITKDISGIVGKTGLQLKNPNDNNVVISIKLELLDPKEITINSSDIKVMGLPVSKTIELPAQTKIKVSGNSSVSAQSLNPAIDVTGLSDGTHEVNLNLTPPDDVALQNNITLNVTINSVEPNTDNMVSETTTSEKNTLNSNEESDNTDENQD